MAHNTISLRHNRRWAWGVCILTVSVLGITLYDAYQQGTLIWPALLLAGGLTAVVVWVTWPMLPDWQLDAHGIHRGRLLVMQWGDVSHVEVRMYAHSMRHPGSIDVVIRTEDAVVRLRIYCCDEAEQVVSTLDRLLPTRCDRESLRSAVATAWPVRR